MNCDLKKETDSPNDQINIFHLDHPNYHYEQEVLCKNQTNYNDHEHDNDAFHQYGHNIHHQHGKSLKEISQSGAIIDSK